MELKQIKGVGNATELKLSELGINSVLSLLTYFPSKCLDLKLPTPVLEAEEGQFSLFEGEVLTVGTPSKRGTKSFNVTFLDTLSAKRVCFKAAFFNQPYLSNTFIEGEKYRLLSKISFGAGEVFLVNPIFERSDKIKTLNGTYTVYPLHGVIGQKTFKNIMEEAFKSYVPESVLESDLIQNLHDVHFPKSIDNNCKAVDYLASFDLCCGLISYQKSRCTTLNQRKVFYNMPDYRIVLRFCATLASKLTDSQHSAIKAIYEDLSSNKHMSRLISGDVGSGKSFVAYAAIFMAVKGGRQAAYMSPTEILAAQQYLKFSSYGNNFGIKSALLTSSIPQSERKEILSGLANGNIDVVFGTQSIIGSEADFCSLSLAVIDEQQRFGVKDRAKLEDKGARDILTMTATPIPRTLALTIYDDIDVSEIIKRPETVSNITTKIVSDEKFDDMMLYIKSRCKQGEQSFIVCPSIKDNEGFELHSIEKFKQEYSAFFEGIAVCFLHGKMKSEEKEAAMKDFSDKKIPLLVATSVIEVGIDTAARNIVILNADRFGLANLHQLRGRVGRGGEASYCFLHTKNPYGRALERLNTVESINDGYLLAEKDFDMRGAGDILGTKQSGKTSSPYFNLPLTNNTVLNAKDLQKRYSGNNDISKLVDKLGADYSDFVEEIKQITLNS